MKERGEQQVVPALPAAPLLFHEQCRPEISMAGPAVQKGVLGSALRLPPSPWFRATGTQGRAGADDSNWDSY